MARHFTDEELEGLSEEEIEAINEPDGDDDDDFSANDDSDGDEDDETDGDKDDDSQDDTKADDHGTDDENKAGKDAIKEAETVKPADNDAGGNPDDADHKPAKVVITEHDTKIAELEKKFNDGDLDFDTYIKDRLGLERDKTREIVRDEAVRMSAENTWKSEQETFFSSNEHLKSNPIVYDSFAREVNRLLKDKAWASKPGGDVLDKAKSLIETAFHLEKPAPEKETSKGKAAVRDAKKASANRATPQTLKDVPAADGNMDGGFEYLDKLDGAAYELAISKLSTEELDAYARA